MARELGLNPRRLGKIANHRQEPWKAPLPQFIEDLYLKRFGRERPGWPRPGSAGIVTRSARSADGRVDAAGPEDLPHVDAATYAEPGQFAVDPAVPPAGVLAGQPPDQGLDVPPGRWPAGPAALGPGGPSAADDVGCQRTIVSGVISSRSPWRRAFGTTPSWAGSAQCNFSRSGCRRCSTASWWRRIRISAVFRISSRRDSRKPRGDPHNQEEREVGPRARCRCCHLSSPASPLPHPPCDSHRNGRSACLTRWPAARWRLLVSGSTGSGCCYRGSGSVSP